MCIGLSFLFALIVNIFPNKSFRGFFAFFSCVLFAITFYSNQLNPSVKNLGLFVIWFFIWFFMMEFIRICYKSHKRESEE